MSMLRAMSHATRARSPLSSFGVRGVALELLEQLCVGDQGVLDHLGAAIGDLCVRERAQAPDIGHDGARLPEYAGEVLARAEVDGGLSSNRGVHHGEQAGGHLYECDAAHVGRRGEPRHVSHHAAAQGHDDVSAREPRARGPLEHHRERLHGLALLARFERGELGGEPRRFKAVHHGGPVQRAHVRVGHHERPPGAGDGLAGDLADLLEQEGPYVHLVRELRIDIEGISRSRHGRRLPCRGSARVRCAGGAFRFRIDSSSVPRARGCARSCAGCHAIHIDLLRRPARRRSWV